MTHLLSTITTKEDSELVNCSRSFLFLFSIISIHLKKISIGAHSVMVSLPPELLSALGDI